MGDNCLSVLEGSTEKKESERGFPGIRLANRLVAPARAAARRLCRDGFPKDWLPVRARTDSPRYSAMKNRKEAMVNMHQVLIKRRDALRQALAGDLSKLKER